MSRFVLDCSMTIPWCLEDESNPRSDIVLKCLDSEEAVVPNHWSLEVANALVVCERRKRVTLARISEFLEFLSGLPITVDEHTAQRAFHDTLALARAWRLSAYDAAYLELAMREGCPLASLDGPLNEAATGLGIELFKV